MNSWLVCLADQTLGTPSGQSQHGWHVAGTQSTAKEQLQGATEWGEFMFETFPLYADLLQSVRVSVFTDKQGAPQVKLRRWTDEAEIRGQLVWGISCCSLLSPHKDPLCWELDWLVNSSQTGNGWNDWTVSTYCPGSIMVQLNVSHWVQPGVGWPGQPQNGKLQRLFQLSLPQHPCASPFS